MADGSEVKVDAAGSVGVRLEMGYCWSVSEIWREGTLEAAERAKDEGAADRSGSLLLREDLSAARSPVRMVLRLAVWMALLAPMGEEGEQAG